MKTTSHAISKASSKRTPQSPGKTLCRRLAGLGEVGVRREAAAASLRRGPVNTVHGVGNATTMSTLADAPRSEQTRAEPCRGPDRNDIPEGDTLPPGDAELESRMGRSSARRSRHAAPPQRCRTPIRSERTDRAGGGHCVRRDEADARRIGASRSQARGPRHGRVRRVQRRDAEQPGSTRTTLEAAS